MLLFLALKIPQTEEPGGLQSMGSQRVGHDRAAEHVLGSKTMDLYASSDILPSA